MGWVDMIMPRAVPQPLLSVRHSCRYKNLKKSFRSLWDSAAKLRQHSTISFLGMFSGFFDGIAGQGGFLMKRAQERNRRLI
jgi:hypothetical protein